MSVYLITNLGNLSIIAVLWSIHYIKKVWIKILIIIITSAFFKFNPGFDIYNFALFISLVVGAIASDHLPLTKKASLISSIVIALVIFNISLYLF